MNLDYLDYSKALDYLPVYHIIGLDCCFLSGEETPQAVLEKAEAGETQRYLG